MLLLFWEISLQGLLLTTASWLIRFMIGSRMLPTTELCKLHAGFYHMYMNMWKRYDFLTLLMMKNYSYSFSPNQLLISFKFQFSVLQ